MSKSTGPQQFLEAMGRAEERAIAFYEAMRYAQQHHYEDWRVRRRERYLAYAMAHERLQRAFVARFGSSLPHPIPHTQGGVT